MPLRFLPLRFFLLATLSVALAAPALSQHPDPGPVKYWIFLRDKDRAAGKHRPAALVRPAPQAQERRDRRGALRPSPDLDVPVAATYLDALSALGVRPVVESRWLNAVSAELSPAQVAALSRLPFVRSVSPVGRALPARRAGPEATGAMRPPLLKLEYGLSYTQLDLINDIPVLDRGIDGTGVRLGFLDTSFDDFQHPAFAVLKAEGRLLAARDFVGQTQKNLHGQSVASVAVGYDPGNLIGPAHGAYVLAATTEYAPSETSQEEDFFVAGLEWLEAEGADVVNVSLGYTTFQDGEGSYTQADLDGDTAVTTRAVDIAASLGLVVVVAAGNEGGCGSPAECWYHIATPADADSVITVGAVTPDSVRAAFSSFGPTADGRIKPDVSAQGTQVLLAGQNAAYVFSSGTSFASPMVAGVVCQILQVNPFLKPIEVRDLLRETASQAAFPDAVLGWGVINAEAAVAAAEARLPEPPPPADGTNSVDVYPNPFSSRTVFFIQTAADLGAARLTVYNVMGQPVAVPFDGALASGFHRFSFDAGALPAGVYFYTLRSEGATETGSLILVR